MQEKEFLMAVRCELKIPSLGKTVQNHLASLVMTNSYPHDGIFNPHLTTIKDSYSQACNKNQFLSYLCYFLIQDTLWDLKILVEGNRPRPKVTV